MLSLAHCVVFPSFIVSILNCSILKNPINISKYQATRFVRMDVNYNDIMIFLQIAVANKILIPAIAAVKFPELEAHLSDCTTIKLPVVAVDEIPDSSLMCLSFRASSQVRTLDDLVSC
jgi:hypothetical protein